MSVKLSIITINYNDKIGLEKTINSIINQSWKDFEFIVIDGGSADGSKEVLEKYQKQISYSISEPDSGVYNAMNKGIRSAKGKYVIFMNAGDSFYNKNVLNNVNRNFDSNLGLLYGNAFCVENNVHVRNQIPPSKLNFSFFYDSGLIHQACFIKKELFDNYFYYNESYKIASDWELFIYTICAKNETYLYVNEMICIYDLSGVSGDIKNSELQLCEREKTLKKYFPLFIDDYNQMKVLNDKRIKNMIYIKKFSIPWKILKGFSKIILLFLPKQRKAE
jgi:glycosyltransferase involved in cell wall biosynthesis